MAHPLNMSKFKKISSDKEHTLMRHEDGHEMKILHKSLTPKIRAQLAALPVSEDASAKDKKETSPKKMAEGGEAEATPTPIPAPKPGSMSYDYRKGNNPLVNFKDNKEMRTPAKDEDPAVEQYAEGTPDEPVQQDVDVSKLGNQGIQAESAQPAPEKQQQPVVVNVNQAPTAQPTPTPASYPEEYNKMLKAQQQQAPQQAPAPAPEQTAQSTPSAQAAAQPGVAPAPTAPQEVSALGARTEVQSGLMGKSLGLEEQGIRGETSANQQIATEQAAQAAAGINERVEMQTDFNDTMQKLQGEHQKFMAEMSDPKNNIDPKRYFHDMNIFQRLGTAVAIGLGGIGGALNGTGANPTMDFINRQIDRDIQAQQANLGKKATLIEANMKFLGNMASAKQMAMIQQRDLVADQIKKAVYQNGSALAKAQGDRMLGDLMSKNVQGFSQIAMMQTLAKSANSASPQVASQLIQHSNIVPDAEKPAFLNETAEAQKYVRAMDNALHNFDKAAALNTVAQRIPGIGSPTQINEQIAALVNPSKVALARETGGKISDTEVEQFSPNWPKWKDDDSTTAIKRQALVDLFKQKAVFSRLQSLNIDPMRWSTHDSQGLPKLQNRPRQPK